MQTGSARVSYRSRKGKGCGRISGVRRGNEQICQWISARSADLKSACIIDGEVHRPLKRSNTSSGWRMAMPAGVGVQVLMRKYRGEV